MEIIYLWIQDHGSIKKQGFNFSGKYRLDYSEGTLDARLTGAGFPDSFFKVGNKPNFKISNITAIVGENGSGKTTLLDFIKRRLGYITTENHDYSYPAIEAPFLLVIEESGQLYSYNFGLDNIRVKGDVKVVEGEFKKIPSDAAEDEYGYYHEGKIIVPALENTKIVYFSNLFDANKIDRDFSYDFDEIFLDISSDSLIVDDITDSNYQKSEVLRQIRFLLSPLAATLLSKVPERLWVRRNERSINFSKEFKKYRIKKQDIEQFEFVLRLILPQGHNDILASIRQVLSLSVLDFMSVYIPLMSNIRAPKDILNLFANNISNIVNSSEDTPIGLLNYIKDQLRSLLTEYPQKLEDTHPIRKAKSLLGKLDHRVSLLRALYRLNDRAIERIRNKLALPLTETQLVQDLLVSSYNSRFEEKIFTIELSGLSSGEMAMLQTYARFYWLIDRFVEEQSYRNFGFTDAGFHIKHYKLKQNLLILIDEGEVFLHPNWQREYVHNIVNLFYELFKNYDSVEHVQVVIASNSPFVISDLPKENIILLGNNQGFTRVLEDQEKFDTFGANIHMLLSQTFFMGNGVIGEFAKNKLNYVIQLLRGEPEERQRKEIEYVISIVGEPIIKSKLKEMYAEKFEQASRIQHIDSEIARLRQERERILTESEDDHDKNS